VPKIGGREYFPELNINKPGMVGEALAGVGVCTQQPGVEKLVRVAEGGKHHRSEGNTHFPLEL
jgi:hypothetical protein